MPEGGIHGVRNESGEPASMPLLFTPGALREDDVETRAGAARRTGMSAEEWTEFSLRPDTCWV